MGYKRSVVVNGLTFAGPNEEKLSVFSNPPGERIDLGKIRKILLRDEIIILVAPCPYFRH